MINEEQLFGLLVADLAPTALPNHHGIIVLQS
jgi:hypothetical protein